jgi:hypothetical protein
MVVQRRNPAFLRELVSMSWVRSGSSSPSGTALPTRISRVGPPHRFELLARPAARGCFSWRAPRAARGDGALVCFDQAGTSKPHNAPSAPAGLARAARNGTSLDRDVGSDMETRRDHDRNELT